MRLFLSLSVIILSGISCLSVNAQNGRIVDFSDQMFDVGKFDVADTVRSQARYHYRLSDKSTSHREDQDYLLQTGDRMRLWIPRSKAFMDSVRFAYGKEKCLGKEYDRWTEESGASSADSYTLLGGIDRNGNLKNRVCLGLLWIEFEEDEPGQEWVLEDETRMIGDLECHKAVSDFRGHHWTAWYAPSIPFTEAPWKFSPLPGIAVEIASEDNSHSFRLVSVSDMNKPMLWEIHKYNWTKTDRKKFLEAQRAAVTSLARAASIIGAEDQISPDFDATIDYTDFLEKE